VQPDEIGEPRAEGHEREPDNETRFGKRAVFYQPRFGLNKQRSHDQQRESHVTNAALSCLLRWKKRPVQRVYTNQASKCDRRPALQHPS